MGVETADHAADFLLHGEQAFMAPPTFSCLSSMTHLHHGFPASADVREIRASRSDGVRLSVDLRGLVLAPEPLCNNGCGV